MARYKIAWWDGKGGWGHSSEAMPEDEAESWKQRLKKDRGGNGFHAVKLPVKDRQR